ncbi:hypothetical protein [Rouxiella chamberiensis]|uniref:Uncharacterized protein n=1 Tax=Rouxiella chamberiensis TaxID=1513468 RepID=A0ABY7HU45_9GAMM|nr:hypothetical protein [Rouxiella chamberiensis]WAT02492.1 hypothetical protein O1V66_07910 [Rouxiella chamberiensis]
MKKMLLSLLVLGSMTQAVHAAEMIGNYTAAGYTHCGGMKVLTSAITSQDTMVLQITDPKTNASQIYFGNRTEDESDKVKYTLSTYNADTKTFTPDPSNTTVNFGINESPAGSKGAELYHLTMAGQQYSCTPYTVFDPLAKK